MLVFDPPPAYPLAFASPCPPNSAANDACKLGPNPGNVPELWVIAGRGGENELHDINPQIPFNTSSYYHNDIWVSRETDPTGQNPTLGQYWFQVRADTTDDPSWFQGRLGHTATLTCTWPTTDCLVTLPQGAKGSPLQRFVYIVGGQGLDANPVPPSTYGEQPMPAPPGGSMFFFDDVWAWRPDVKDESFLQDFTPEALFGTGDGVTGFDFKNNSPSLLYVSPASPIESLVRLVPPTKIDKNDNRRPQERPYLSSHQIEMLNKNNITTIGDLADKGKADVYTVLRLRGYDYPQVPLDQRLDFESICDVRALAIAVVDKCSVNIPSETLYDSQRNQPKNVVPEWGGGMPGLTAQNILWHGPDRTDYAKLFPSGKGTDDPVSQLDAWDGCAINPVIDNPIHGTNVEGIGYVQQVSKIRNPLPELQELQCKWTPGLRAYHSGASCGSSLLFLVPSLSTFSRPVSSHLPRNLVCCCSH